MNLPEISSMRRGILFGEKETASIVDLIEKLRKNKDRISPSLYESQLQLLKDIADKEKYIIRTKISKPKEGEKKK